MVSGFKRLATLLRLQKTQEADNEVEGEEVKRGDAMGKRMVGKAKKAQKKSGKGIPKKTKKGK
jgi:hypothetical protein